jgi:hypothetical protein
VFEADRMVEVAWLEQERIEVGDTIPFVVSDIETPGLVTVTAIGPCEDIEPDDGTGRRLVTAVFRSVSRNVVDVVLDGQAEPIGCTATHPFWSVDRKEWVAAGELRRGERLLSESAEVVRVVSVTPCRGPPAVVYNLEVDAEHAYRVGEDGVLVHNTCLRQNIIKTGSYPDDLVDAHHIVARNLDRAQPARDVLGKHSIDIDNAMNGVYLPKNASSRARGALHEQKGHTLRASDEYIDAVNNRIIAADAAGGRAAVLRELQKIRSQLLDGVFPGVRPNY